jgi:hypothetical protein
LPQFIQHIDPNEEEAVNKFLLPHQAVDKRTLYDIIQDKIARKQQDLVSNAGETSMQV